MRGWLVLSVALLLAPWWLVPSLPLGRRRPTPIPSSPAPPRPLSARRPARRRADRSAAAATRRARVTTRSRAAVALSKNEQILQRLTGAVGSPGARTPTTALGVGTQQVMQVNGGGVKLFTKSTGAVVGSSTNLKGFFNVTAANTTVNDPTVAFDLLGNRWVLTGIATDDQGTATSSDDEVGLVVRVSKGATLKWSQKSWRTPFGYAETDDVTESKPDIGISGDKVVITTVAVDASDATVAHRIFVLPKGQLYASTVSGPDIWVSSVNNTYDGQTPSVNASAGNAAFVAVPDTDDFTVYTLTGQAKASAPLFSKSVMYPTPSLVDAPDVPQTAGEDIALASAVNSASVSWRNGTMWAALTVGCTPSGDSTQRACLRLLKVTTSSGVSLEVDETRAVATRNWFAPGVAIDGKGLPHVGFSYSTSGGPVGSAAMVRMSNGTWTGPKVISKGQVAFDAGTASPTGRWSDAGAAAVDPTSPWDVWVSVGHASNVVAPPNWATSVARVSLALNVAKVKASKTRAKKGSPVTFTASLKRPQSSDGIQGLPVQLQFKVKGSSKWKVLGNAKTDAQGQRKGVVDVSKTGDYRTRGRAVKQSGGQGQLVNAVTGPSVRVVVH